MATPSTSLYDKSHSPKTYLGAQKRGSGSGSPAIPRKKDAKTGEDVTEEENTAQLADLGSVSDFPELTPAMDEKNDSDMGVKKKEGNAFRGLYICLTYSNAR